MRKLGNPRQIISRFARPIALKKFCAISGKLLNRHKGLIQFMADTSA